MSYGDEGLKALVGKTLTKVEISDEYLVFTDTAGEVFSFDVEGDCCSHSYFYDIYHPNRLVRGEPVLEVETIALTDPDDANARKGDCVVAYGYRIVTEGKWGDWSTVVSFRNDSNGYYGGWMNGPSDTRPINLVDVSDKDWYVVQ